jgi:hypothetical protein
VDHDEFLPIEETFRSDGAEAVFDLLMRRARESRNYRVLFSTGIMRVRHRLGLPLIETEPVSDLTAEQRLAYETAFREAAREAGALCLAGGDIAGAWPYFKAIGEPAAVAAAIDSVAGGDNLDRVIEIAFQEGVNPRKGFELILEHHGICSAITWFGSCRDYRSRQECLRLLVRTLYRDIASALKRSIASAESGEPQTDRLADLIAGRDWLFEGMSSYTDSTHVASVLRYAPELEDDGALRMALEIAEYGQRLDPMYHFRGDPPFEETYRDHAVYLRTLLGEDVEAGVAHFRAKIGGPEDGVAAEVLINLLSRLERYAEAIQTSVEYLPEASLQLCQQARDYATLRNLARQRDDIVGFAAGIIQG